MLGPGSRPPSPGLHRCCDPHRPRRAGAGLDLKDGHGSDHQGCDPHRPRRAGAGVKFAAVPGIRLPVVAILTDPGGPVLAPRGSGRSCRTWGCDPHRPRRAGAGRRALVADAADPDVAILTDPGGPVLAGSQSGPPWPGRGCDPHRPRRAGAGGRRTVGSITVRRLLRSSPTPEGRCWAPTRRMCSSPTRCCDPHRPRRAGAGVP